MWKSWGAAALLALAACGAAQAKDAARSTVVIEVGDTPPDVFGKDEADRPISLAALHGKVVILTFWTSWCGYCLKELPILESIQKVAGKAQLEVIAVNSREDRRTYRNLRKHLKDFEFTMTGDWNGTVSDAYGISSIPHMFIIGRDGKVAHVFHGYSEDGLPAILDKLNATLAAPAAPGAPATAASPAAAP